MRTMYLAVRFFLLTCIPLNSVLNVSGQECIFECEWETWGSWTACLETCDIWEQKFRTRSPCCPDYILDIDDCIDYCGLYYSDSEDQDDCGCSNGGTLSFPSLACSCKSGFNGTCCEQHDEASKDEDNNPALAIGLSTSGAIIVILGVAVVVFFVIKRERSNADTRAEWPVSYNKENVSFERPEQIMDSPAHSPNTYANKGFETNPSDERRRSNDETRTECPVPCLKGKVSVERTEQENDIPAQSPNTDVNKGCETIKGYETIKGCETKKGCETEKGYETIKGCETKKGCETEKGYETIKGCETKKGCETEKGYETIK
ncbi:hypothetical protein MAR_033667, partial [Mya arenaria]